MLHLLAALIASAVPPTGPTCQGPLPAGVDAPRPVLSGPRQERAVGAFRLHWTDEGEDAADPDLLEATLAELRALQDTLPDTPWRPLVGDDGTHGPEMDVYLVQIPANGFANAVTPAAGEAGHSCFIRLDPDIEGFGAVTARSVVRHEVAHCQQYRYTVDSHPWMYEAAATYEQYRPSLDDPGLELLTNVLWSQRIGAPDKPLDAVGNRFEYAGFTVVKYLDETGAPPWVLFEALAETPAWPAGLAAVAGGDLDGLVLEAEAFHQGACGRQGQVSRSYEEPEAACTSAALAPRASWPGGEHRVSLDGWTRVAFDLSPADATRTVPAVDCRVEAGRLALWLDGPGADLDGDHLDAAHAADPDPSIVVRLPEAPDGAVLIVGATSPEAAAGTCTVAWAAPPPPQIGRASCRERV